METKYRVPLAWKYPTYVELDFKSIIMLPNLSKTTLIVLSTIHLLFFSCGNIELPTSNGKEEGELPADTTEYDGYAYTVSQLLNKHPMGETVRVIGYIVGYAKSSINKPFFQIPIDGPNTNMLLADSPETSTGNLCITVQLSTSGLNFREQLNLFENPEMYKARIAIEGTCDKYMNTIGIRPVDDYIYPLEEGELPENPEDVRPNVFPQIRHTPEVVKDAR